MPALSGETPMKPFAVLIALGLIAAAAPVASRAQGQAPSPTTPVTGMNPDRTIADPATRKTIRAWLNALREKRAASRKQARPQKILLLTQRAYVRTDSRSCGVTHRSPFVDRLRHRQF